MTSTKTMVKETKLRTRTGKRFQPRKSRLRIKILFCWRIWRHNKPAKEEGIVKLKAPIFDDIAVAKIADVRILGSSITREFILKCGSEITFTINIVAPMLVPIKGHNTMLPSKPII